MTDQTVTETPAESDDIQVYAVEYGAIVSVPVWETHKRGKNWAAVISVSPKDPGGLARTFLDRGRGGFKYMVDSLNPGDPVEFAGDYYTTCGNKRTNRYYGVVLERTDTHLKLRQYYSADSAVRAGEKLRAQLSPPQDEASPKTDLPWRVREFDGAWLIYDAQDQEIGKFYRAEDAERVLAAIND